jgi:hypothetical protein
MLNHYTSTVAVFQTDQYKNFTMIKGNRPLNEMKMNRIIKQIETGNDMLQYYPIQVRIMEGKMQILDGQHRFMICKKLKRAVHYIIVTEAKSMSDIANVNSNVEKWKGENFINCYIQEGNENYVILQQFLEKYAISLSVTLLLLKNGNPGVEGAHVELNESFRIGTYEVKHLEAATEIAEMCKLFRKFPHWRSRAFIIAIYRIYKAGLISVGEVFTAYEKQPEMLTQQANYKAYISQLEQIVNVRKQKRILIS